VGGVDGDASGSFFGGLVDVCVGHFFRSALLGKDLF
jgi:hypothetical protein